jgi:hypothetical protein
VTHHMRVSALRRYIVFRIKAMEFLDLNSLRETLRMVYKKDRNATVPLPGFSRLRPPIYVSDSVRTVVLSWFCVFIDQSKDGMDVTRLWIELFPKHATRVEDAWGKMKSAWPILRDFRDRAGFHADKPGKFFGARNNIRINCPSVETALEEFIQLLTFFLGVEGTELPELESELDKYLEDLQVQHKVPYQKESLKAYLMIGHRGGLEQLSR